MRVIKNKTIGPNKSQKVLIKKVENLDYYHNRTQIAKVAQNLKVFLYLRYKI